MTASASAFKSAIFNSPQHNFRSIGFRSANELHIIKQHFRRPDKPEGNFFDRLTGSDAGGFA